MANAVGVLRRWEWPPIEPFLPKLLNSNSSPPNIDASLLVLLQLLLLLLPWLALAEEVVVVAVVVAVEPSRFKLANALQRFNLTTRRSPAEEEPSRTPIDDTALFIVAVKARAIYRDGEELEGDREGGEERGCMQSGKRDRAGKLRFAVDVRDDCWI